MLLLILLTTLPPLTPLDGIQRPEQSFFVSQPETEVRLAKSPSRLLKTAAAVIVEERK